MSSSKNKGKLEYSNSSFKFSSSKGKVFEDENYIKIISNTDKNYKIIRKISEGSYGQIFQIKIEVENFKIKAAMKLILSNQKGLSVLELFIMTNIYSINLTHAIKIDIDSYGNTKIIQPLANCDLADIVRKNNIKIDENNLKFWLWQIVKGLYELHSRNIIHGDLKARNILYFQNENNLRLTDFGLSVFLNNRFIKNNSLYTPTHRPLEVFLNDDVSFYSDIWALGCTFYEIVYGKFLFSPQSNNDNYILNLRKWENQEYELDTSFQNDNSEVKCLILSMLNPNKERRPNIYEILRSNYFRDLRMFNYTPINHVFKNNRGIDLNIINQIYDFTDDIYVINFTFNLFLKLTESGITPSLKICYIISKKIVKGDLEENLNLTFDELQNEIDLCKFLNFNFF